MSTIQNSLIDLIVHVNVMTVRFKVAVLGFDRKILGGINFFPKILSNSHESVTSKKGFLHHKPSLR